MKRKLKTYDMFLESSGDELNLKRNKWKKMSRKDAEKVSDEIYNLIEIAYSEIGGHLKVNSPDDVTKDESWNFWEGVDIHDSPDLDVVIWGKKTKYGVKFSGVGHDGKKDSKRKYLDQRGSDLKNLGFFIEVSGKLAEILMAKYEVPYVEGEENINKILNKQVEYHGDHPVDASLPGKGWYSRKIGGKLMSKIVLGRPKGIKS